AAHRPPHSFPTRRSSDLSPEIRAFTPPGGILPVADRIPRPSVERAVLHVHHEVRHHVRAEMISLVDDAPQPVRTGLHREPRAVKSEEHTSELQSRENLVC